MRTFTVIAALLLAPVFFISCNKAEEPQQQPPVKMPAVAAKAQVSPETLDPNAGAAGSAEGASIRNPFQSHIMILKASSGAPAKIKGPLECCETNVFRLVAAVVGVGEGEGFALVQAPDGKRYVVRRGDSMGARDGKIIKINSKSIIVREHTRDDDGTIKSTEDIELRLLDKKV